jgi:tRNA pseudouridine38-40 synthase
MGTSYVGFQSQPGKASVQSVLEGAIGRVTGERVRIIGSGRTDAGAHACAQVIAFSTESSLSADVLGRAINAYLPDDITVTSISEVDEAFHPRFDARSRTYRYLIWNRPTPSPFWEGRAMFVRARLDVGAMAEAALQLQGTHDFGAFVASSAPGNRIRTMYSAQCWREGDMVLVELDATGFMQQMVRTIAGTLVRVGLGKLSLGDFSKILASHDRVQAWDTAPAHGLYLMRVRYASDAKLEINGITEAQRTLPATGGEE